VDPCHARESTSRAPTETPAPSRNIARWLAALAAIASCLPGTLPAADDFTVRFLAPPLGRPVSGETRVRLAVVAPPGNQPVTIEVTVDGQRIALLDHPPYEFTWNAGPDFQPHHLVAAARDNSGHTATATLDTPPLRIGQRETVSLVNLYVAVSDPKDKPVEDLRSEDFRVFEDDVRQEISHFTAARQPLTVTLLMDTSNSMGTGERIETARKAALEFVKRIGLGDRVSLISFNDSVRELLPLTGDRKLLEAAISDLSVGGGTALYDALVRAATALQNLEGHKALILLSDGRDQAFRENAPGSLHVFEEAMEAVERAEVTLYSIGLGARLESETDLTQHWTLKAILGSLADKTGGRFYNPERPGQLSGIYQQISDDLSKRYTLAYSPKNQSRDGRWRTVRVETTRPGLKVVTRPGYYAPSR